MSKPDIAVPRNMLAIQGDRVIVYSHGAAQFDYVLTLIRVIGVDGQEMRMVNRDDKSRKPDWSFTQKWYDSLRPARENKENAKWEVTLKARA